MNKYVNEYKSTKEMASLEKLTKSLEALKVIQPSDVQKKIDISKKEKIFYCSVIAESICNSNIRSAHDFQKVLGIAIETFLLCCDDDDSDVRLMADECLNRTIKTLLDTHLNRLQLELYKEIKKDGPARSLRAALSRFGDLCHRIRPEKFRPYAVNLLPCLAKISQRANEESVQETLALTITKVMPVLGQFTYDKEIRMLLDSFLPNLSDSSATVRRAAASSLITVCENSRRPPVFLSWLLTTLFDTILPVQENHPLHAILGILLCFRHFCPYLSDPKQFARKSNAGSRHKDEDFPFTKVQTLKIFEITIYFANHTDHNVVTAALETLYQLLKAAPEVLQNALMSPYGMEQSLIYSSEINKLNRVKSESQSSMLPSQTSIYDDSALEDDHDIYLSERSVDEDSQIFIEETSKTSFDQSEDIPSFQEGDSDDVSEYSGIKIAKLSDDNSYVMNMPGIHLSSTPKKMPSALRKGTIDDKYAENADEEYWGEQSSSPSPSTKSQFKVGNIGTFVGPDVPINYCCRLLCSSFLLPGTPGTCMPDRNSRVSVKSLALNCLSYIFTINPKAVFLDLHLDSDLIQTPEQKIWDVFLFTCHSDPHLKGQCAVTLGHLILKILKDSGGWWNNWIDFHGSPDFPSFENLLSKLMSVVQDTSSVAVKLGLSGLKKCLNAVIESAYGSMVFAIFDTLISVRDTSYWLVKVELLDVLSEIPFKVVSYLETKRNQRVMLQQNTQVQTKFLNHVFISLLGDEDFRVRQAAALGIVKLVPNLFFPSDHPYQDPIIAIAREGTTHFFDILQNSTLQSTLPLVHALVMPFSNEDSLIHNHMIEGALTRTINILVVYLRTSTSKYFSFGCCQALCLLSQSYLITIYPNAWKAVFSEIKSVAKPCRSTLRHYGTISSSNETSEESALLNTDLFNHLISLLTHTTYALDLVAHLHTLHLIGNLLCAMSLLILNEKQKSAQMSSSEEQEDSSIENMVKPYAEQVFSHLMKVLNIFAHVLDEQPPVVISSRPALPSLPNAPSLSPMKRKNKIKEETLSQNSSVQTRSPTRIIQEKSDADKDKSNVKSLGHVGTFHLSPLYSKLYAILKSAYSSYKISMDFQSNEKFCQLLKCTLDVLSQLLEIVDSIDMGKHAEEMLSYLKSVMAMEPCSSIQCVRQLLKSLFGTNLVALHQEALLNISDQKISRQTSNSSSSPGLYHTCITEPYTKFTHLLINKSFKSNTTDMCGEDELLSSLSWMKRSDKLTTLLKSGTKCDKANLAAHIKLFEAVVIKALKLYTITSNVKLQCQVLDLLTQLVQLRVNYCLLDSDQIFIGFIMKQIEYIEEGQILKAGVIIPRIFYFLVLLSYERFHSRPIMSIPRILQLCDGLIASGQPPEDFVIKAIQPVVEDLFLVRGMNKVDLGKELDAQREVVISSLFKLLQYPQVSELFLLIVNQTLKEGPDKWKKLSRQIVDTLLPLLSRQQLQVDKQAHLNILHKLLETLASVVFRPVDILLKALFTQPKDLNLHPNLHRWMSMVLIILRIIISHAREEVVLSRIHDMHIIVNIYTLAKRNIPHSEEKALQGSSDTSQTALHFASETLARFLFQAVGVCVDSISNNLYSIKFHHDAHEFLCQQVSHMLLYLMYMFQSGMFIKVTASAMEFVKKNKQSSSEPGLYYTVTKINAMFLKMSSTYPTLVIQWCNVLTLLNYDCQLFWSQILLSDDSSTLSSTTKRNSAQISDAYYPCNSELVRRAGVALLCDYVCENPNDAELMTLLIVNHVNDLIHLSMETTIKDFFSAIHRNPAASGLLIQAVNARCTNLAQPVFMKRALLCLETVHNNQSANLLPLLIEKFLPTHCLVLARNCERIICQRIEILSTDSTTEQLHAEDIEKLIDFIISTAMDQRHNRVVSSLKKLQSTVNEPSSQHLSHPLVESLNDFKNLELNKGWFTDYVKKLCFAKHPLVKECALLLSHLKYEDAFGIMSCKEFQLQILEQCLKLGAEMTLTSERYISGKSNDPFLGVKNTSESPLYRASKSTLLLHIRHISALESTAPISSSYIQELFSKHLFWEIVYPTASATSSYLKILKHIFESNITDDLLEDIVKISILCCEAVIWTLSSETEVLVSPKLLHLCLELLNDSLRNPLLFAIIALPEKIHWSFSAINAIYQLVIYLNPNWNLKPIKYPELSDELAVTPDQTKAQQACIKIATAVEWLENCKQSDTFIPEFIFTPLKSVIRGLSRLPYVNSFSRTPPILWQLGWKPDFGGEYKTVVPPPPGEYLQDRDVLKQYIYRVNLLGWISRQQFEETWMALLGVLSATPIDEMEGKEEDLERIRTSCLAVKSITALLLQTLLLPDPGNPQNSTFLTQPRDKPLAFLHTKSGKKMLYVRDIIHRALQEHSHHERNDDYLLNLNAERVSCSCHYSLSQVSLEYLCAAAGFLEENDEADESVSSNSSPLSATLGGAACYHQREQSLATAGLDIHSCLHFLLDLYSQWLSPSTCPSTPLSLLTEVTRSVVILSDIFMERAQFEWLLDTLLEVQRVHPAEDEIIAQYLIFGICKAAAVLGLESDVLERLKKLLELNLKSTYLPTRISTLHGFLFLLEQGGGDDYFPLLPAASDCILKHLDSSNIIKPSGQNEDYMLIMWAVSFYIMENYQCEADFTLKVLEISLNICGGSDDVPLSIYLTIVGGLERLLVAGAFLTKEIEQLLKLSTDRITSSCPFRSLAALSLLLSCMYIGKSNNLWVLHEALPSITRVSEKSDGSIKQLETENLIAALERVTTLFERIRKSYPLEAAVICKVLPPFLIEFFPMQDILNKVIGEFLSSQQPHPQHIAHVIHEVFKYLNMQSCDDIIQDWIMLSLSNFTQRSPIAMAIWSLCCFFVSATSNSWLQAIFPYVQNRMGKIETSDTTLFCASGVDFRNHLKDEEQKQLFFGTIQSVAHPDTPYADLLSCL